MLLNGFICVVATYIAIIGLSFVLARVIGEAIIDMLFK